MRKAIALLAVAAAIAAVNGGWSWNDEDANTTTGWSWND